MKVRLSKSPYDTSKTIIELLDVEGNCCRIWSISEARELCEQINEVMHSQYDSNSDTRYYVPFEDSLSFFHELRLQANDRNSAIFIEDNFELIYNEIQCGGENINVDIPVYSDTTCTKLIGFAYNVGDDYEHPIVVFVYKDALQDKFNIYVPKMNVYITDSSSGEGEFKRAIHYGEETPDFEYSREAFIEEIRTTFIDYNEN